MGGGVVRGSTASDPTEGGGGRRSYPTANKERLGEKTKKGIAILRGERQGPARWGVR